MGALPHQKIFKSENAISSTPRPIAVSEKLPKINRYFLLNFDKKSVVISLHNL